MNKQIEHLFNEAGFHKPEMERLGIEHKFEKFAELIVRECAEVAGCNGHVSGFALGDLIKEHFGVEE
jgi:hypothetical protein